MRIETARFGPLDLDQETVIHFPWGIPGFENLKRFVLLDHRQGPFQWLQAVDDPQVAFVVCLPEVMGVKYRVPEDKLKPLELAQIDDLVLLIMVSFNREKGAPRPHLAGPLLFNSMTRKACQWSIESRELPKVLFPVE